MNRLVIEKEDLRYNINKIKEYIDKNNEKSPQIIAVVKSNAYGLGIVEYSEFLKDNGIDFFAVSTIEEALELRRAGIKEKILMLSSTAVDDDVKLLVEYDIILSIGSQDAAEVANKIGQVLNKQIKVHIKIDTGFGRYGFVYNNKEDMIKVLPKFKNIKIEGTYTHFSNAYYDDKYTQKQFNRFFDCIEVLKMNKIETGMLHVCNTSAFIKFPNMHLNAVRIGSGFNGRISFSNNLGLKKIGTLESNVSEIKYLYKGFNVGYSNTYKTKKDTKIAIIPCGYMNGLNLQAGKDMFRLVDKLRYLSNDLKSLFKKEKIYVEINNKKYPVLGRVGTYHITVDITNSDIKINDNVILNANPKYVDRNIRREWI